MVKPNFGVSTIQTYKNFKLDKVDEHPDVDELIQAMQKDDLKYVANNMMNLLELVTIEEHKEISDIKKFMCNEGAIGAMMSGSGPTVFGFFQSINAAESCAEKLKKNYREVFVTKTI